MKITIPGELTDLNQFIDRCRNAFLLAKAAGFKVNGPAFLKITWFCKNKRKDKDNIAFALKFIQDGMVAAGVIRNDGWKEIDGFSHHFEVDKDAPRIEIEVEELKYG